MYKKIIIITIILLSTISGVYFGYRYYIYYYPINGTGAAPSEVEESEIRKGTAISNLIKSLPIQFDNFAIETYDYSKGKFRVMLNDKFNATPDIFYKWLLTSEYRAIPFKMFYVQSSN